MGLHAQNIAAACKISRGYAERILVGVKPEQFARKAVVNGTTIDANHPAWVFGHLATYPAKLAAMVGLDPAKFAAPANFEAIFKDGTPCQDDPSGTIYPSMESVTTAFFRTHDALIEALGSVDDAKLIEPTPDEKARARFPLLGGRVLFMANNHIMMHMGQVSTWRRCMGMPAA
ncbi:MAG TPA: DinB family protein [Phycisphaerales bacterium]|nr:DinB family protein [Phycisphaerales bacterium]